MRVAGKGDRALALREPVECGGDGLGAQGELRQCLAHVQAQGGEHLVIARAAQMNARAGRANALGQASFECGLAILVAELDAPLPARVRRRQRLESRTDRRAVGRAKQALRLKHLCVGDGRAHVVGHQAFIECVVLAGGESQHPLIERCALVPQSAHAASKKNGLAAMIALPTADLNRIQAAAA